MSSNLPLSEPLYPRPAEASTKHALHETLEVLRRGKWHIVGVFLLVLAGVAVYTFSTTPQYTASTLLLVSPQQSPSTSEALSYGYVEAAGLGERESANQVFVLQESVDIAERVAERLHALRTVPETDRPITLQGESVTETVSMLQGSISADIVADDMDAIEISVNSEDPAEAALIADLYAEEYVKHTRDVSRRRITSSRAFLEDQIENRLEELRRLEDEIEAYRRQEGAVDLDVSSQYTVTQIAQLEAALDEEHIDQIMHEATLRATEEELQQIHPRLTQQLASGAEKEIESWQVALADLESRLEQIYLHNPELRDSPSEEVGDLESRIAAIRDRTRLLSEQYVGELLDAGGIDPTEGSGMAYLSQLNRQIVDERIAISGAHAKISAIERRLAAYRQKLDAIPSQSIQLAQLERARQSNEQVYTHLVQQLQEARMAEESEIGLAQVIRPALAPEMPSHPNIPRNLILGGLLGLLLGMVAASVRHRLDTRVYTPDDVNAEASLIGTIPDLHLAMKKVPGGTFRSPDRRMSTALAPISHPVSPSAEAYRRVYLNLQFRHQDKEMQTVLITSGEAGAGKSTTAVNLALTAARARRRTLIIDADFHRPTVHRLLGIPQSSPGPDIKDLLLDGQHDLPVERFIRGPDNVFVLPARKPVAGSTELLGSARMRHVIEQLRASFDVIIFDSPPVLVATDALLLATQCDATILVASAGSTDLDALKHTIGDLEDVGASLAGIVLNRFDPTHMYAYKYTYGYRDQYYADYAAVG